jgi:hypothetical protein
MQRIACVHRVAHASRDWRHCMWRSLSDLSVCNFICSYTRTRRYMRVRRARPISAKSLSFQFPPGTTLKATRTSHGQLSRSLALAQTDKKYLAKENNALRRALSGWALGLVPGMLSGGISAGNSGSTELQKVRERLVGAQTQSSGLADLETRMRSMTSQLNALDVQQTLYRRGVMKRIAEVKKTLMIKTVSLKSQQSRIKTPLDRAAIVQQITSLKMSSDRVGADIRSSVIAYNTDVAQRRTKLLADLAAATSEYQSAQRASQDLVALQRRASELSKVVESPIIPGPRRRSPQTPRRPSPRATRLAPRLAPLLAARTKK